MWSLGEPVAGGELETEGDRLSLTLVVWSNVVWVTIQCLHEASDSTHIIRGHISTFVLLPIHVISKSSITCVMNGELRPII